MLASNNFYVYAKQSIIMRKLILNKAKTCMRNEMETATLTLCTGCWPGCDTSHLDQNRPRISVPAVLSPRIVPSVYASDNCILPC